MARFQLVGPSYTSQSRTADAQQTKNWYPESIESGQGKSLFALYPTPGLRILYTLPAGKCRPNGSLTINGRMFQVAGNMLYELFANGTFISRGNVHSDGLPVSMAAAYPIAQSGTPQLAVVSAGGLYVLNLLTNQLTVPQGPVGTPFQIVYADGFYVLLNTNGVFQFSNGLDATTWQGIETEAVSSYGDQTLAINSTHRELWLFSAQRATVYYDAGDNPIPFDEISGGDMEQGIAAPWSVVTLDNTVFWLGANKDGAGIVWRASGYTPLRVSNHAVEYALQSYSTFTDAVAYGYQDQGHTFYVLYLPTANKTWVYDVATQMWHERSFGISGSNETAHRSCSHAYCFGMHLVGDWSTGNVYQMSITQTQDFGNPIRRVRRSPHISNENEWMFFQSLQVDLETGLQPSQLLPGQAQPTIYTLQDANLNGWNLSINDQGLFQIVPSASKGYSTIYLNDPASATTWLLGVSTSGQLISTEVALIPTGATSFTMFSYTGQSEWVIRITNVGLVQATLFATVYRNPTMMMRFSDDAAHTWTSYRTCDTGAPGNYKARVIWRRLGRSRDRVFELSVTDPIPWRIVDGFLKADPGYV